MTDDLMGYKSLFGLAREPMAKRANCLASFEQGVNVTTWYGLLHYDYLMHQTGPVIFFSTYLI